MFTFIKWCHIRINYPTNQHIRSLIFIGLIIFFASHHKTAISNPLITYPIKIGENSLRVEVANNAELRRRGLMKRTSLSPNRGMIFIFPQEQRISMWMKDTPIDLTVLFIDSQGIIINIAHMKRESLEHHASAGPAKYALEINSDSPLAKRIKPGVLVLGLTEIPPAKN